MSANPDLSKSLKPRKRIRRGKKGKRFKSCKNHEQDDIHEYSLLGCYFDWDKWERSIENLTDNDDWMRQYQVIYGTYPINTSTLENTVWNKSEALAESNAPKVLYERDEPVTPPLPALSKNSLKKNAVELRSIVKFKLD